MNPGIRGLGPADPQPIDVRVSLDELMSGIHYLFIDLTATTWPSLTYHPAVRQLVTSSLYRPSGPAQISIVTMHAWAS